MNFRRAIIYIFWPGKLLLITMLYWDCNYTKTQIQFMFMELHFVTCLPKSVYSLIAIRVDVYAESQYYRDDLNVAIDLEHLTFH